MSFRRRMMNVPPKAKRYIYNSGDECVSLTGGWVQKGENSNAGIFRKNADSIEIYTAINGSYTSMRTENTIDLTEFSKLFVDVYAFMRQNHSNAVLNVLSAVDDSKVTFNLKDFAESQAYPITVDGVVEINLTEITADLKQQAYIGFTVFQAFAYQSAQLKLRKAWLE